MSEKVIDFHEKRKESVERKRRNFERVMFKNFLGFHGVIDDEGALSSVKIIDISQTGVLFQLPDFLCKEKKFEEGDVLSLRLYFTKESYIVAFVQVRYTKFHQDPVDGRTMQYGCEFDREVSTFKAFQSFIDFIYKFAEYSYEDRDEGVSFLF